MASTRRIPWNTVRGSNSASIPPTDGVPRHQQSRFNFQILAKLDRGIQIYNGSQGRWQVVREGLPSQNVTAFAFTSDHVLAGTDRGVVEIRKDAF